MKALVVYYSRTGATREVAVSVSKALGCDIEEIKDIKGRKGLFGFLKSGREAMGKKLPEILYVCSQKTAYEILIIGTPIWVGTMASPVRTFITHEKGKLHRAAFFCTMEGKDEQRAFSDMEGILGTKPVCTLAIQNRLVKSGEYRQRVSELVADVIKEE